MKIVFYENQYGGFIDKAIRFKTATWQQRINGEWKHLPSHVELLFDNSEMFSASQYENRVRFKMCNTKSPVWKMYDIKIDNAKDYKVLYAFCVSQIGKKYDYFGILNFVIPFIHNNKNKWFCSEICTKALQVGNVIPNDIKSYTTSPAKLEQIIQRISNE